MILTKDEVKSLPNGTILTAFLSGKDWDEYCGKAIQVVKIDDTLREIKAECFDIDDVNSNLDENGEDFEIVIVIKKIPNESSISIKNPNKKQIPNIIKTSNNPDDYVTFFDV